MRFSSRLFFAAGIYGLVVLAPMYFLEGLLGREDPPPITHPEYFYGFLGVAVAWQVAFLIIATDPSRYRALMVPSVLEKLGYGVAVLVLAGLGRVTAGPVATGCIDLVFAALFTYAFVRVGRERM
ncbi:MAG: hypothetical protein DWQ37_16495 [Planctomycetota bacterium]|nr:MAG: hypothetical protein DWQ37_16495 [Planctomycetota bacterium]